MGDEGRATWAGQLLPAFIAKLVIEGVPPEVIERAIWRVQDIKPGDSLSDGDAMLRAFAFEQAKILEHAM